MASSNGSNGSPSQGSSYGAHAAKQKKKGPIVALAALVVVLLAAGIGGAAYYATQNAEMNRAAQEQASTPTPATPSTSASQQNSAADEKPDNPIDFVQLKTENPDIYAWIYVPGTDVNLPILQSVVDDDYYLTHNVDGQYAAEGAIYTQSLNKTDFSDPVTLIYGHNLVNGSMFSALHYFEDSTFFNEHDTMYIYTMGHILTYRIVSAYQYDDRHILNSFDFSKESVVQSYFDYVSNPDSLVKNVRDGVQLKTTDKIVQLSTCTDTINHTDTRYLVTGVLVSDQATK